MITEERILAVRRLREEADKLRMACVEAAETGALLHITFDQKVTPRLPFDMTIEVARLRAVQ